MYEREELLKAIENVYQIFARYPLRHPVQGCPCCVHPKDQQRLIARPLRLLESNDLTRYMAKALSTWGDSEDFRHFLPRILEICALENYHDYPDIEIIFGKLRSARWRDWPYEEQEVVEAYLIALWHDVLSVPSAAEAYDSAVDTFLIAIGMAVDDLAPFLKVWQQTQTLSASHHLAIFVLTHYPSIVQKRCLSSTFWSRQSTQTQQVVTWLYRPELLQVLEDAFFQYSDTDFADTLSDAVDALSILASIRQ